MGHVDWHALYSIIIPNVLFAFFCWLTVQKLQTIWKVIDLQTTRINLQNKAIIELYERVDALENPPIEIELPDGYSGWRAS